MSIEAAIGTFQVTLTIQTEADVTQDEAHEIINHTVENAYGHYLVSSVETKDNIDGEIEFQEKRIRDILHS